VVTSMGPRNAYKDMLDNVVSPITCVSMNHQNQLEQMANRAISLQRDVRLRQTSILHFSRSDVLIHWEEEG
jgi:hypothetical protein